jgi:hypothetical protein
MARIIRVRQSKPAFKQLQFTYQPARRPSVSQFGETHAVLKDPRQSSTVIDFVPQPNLNGKETSAPVLWVRQNDKFLKSSNWIRTDLHEGTGETRQRSILDSLRSGGEPSRIQAFITSRIPTVARTIVGSRPDYFASLRIQAR